MFPLMQFTPAKSEKSIIEFKGLDHRDVTALGTLKNTFNVSSAAYPALAPRGSRSAGENITDITALGAKDELFYVAGTGFYYNSVLKGSVTAGAKRFAVVNTKIIIWPDKKYYDTAADVFGDLGATFTGSVTFAETEFASTITSTVAMPFGVGDGIIVTGTAGNNISAIVRDVSANSMVLTFDKVFTAETVSATIKREIPDMDYICSSDNRLWGCGGSTIYGSALGDPKNFNVYDGVATDSYTVAVGSDGAWTGCRGFASHIFFSKENIVHKLYGTKPSNYSITDGHIDGVMAGCEKSMAVINDVLYYWSRLGLMAYTGSVPSRRSEGIGEYSNAVAGVIGQTYYVSMKKGDTWGLYAYDTRKGVWLREDETHVVDFAKLDGKLHYLAGAKIYTMNDGTEVVEWEAELNEISENVPQRKNYTKLSMRAKLEEGSTMSVEVDSGEGYTKVASVYADSSRTFHIPIRSARSDVIKIKLSGKGKALVYQLVREVKARET